jgi:hypothetical protein
MSSGMMSDFVILAPIISIADVSGGQSPKKLDGVWFKKAVVLGKMAENRKRQHSQECKLIQRCESLSSKS